VGCDALQDRALVDPVVREGMEVGGGFHDSAPNRTR
jgi:hypothetical protein